MDRYHISWHERLWVRFRDRKEEEESVTSIFSVKLASIFNIYIVKTNVTLNAENEFLS